MTRLRILAGAAAMLLAACGSGESKMQQAVLFSAIDGQVVKSGQPLAGVTLNREWSFTGDGKRGHDSATTDASGHFAFPAVIVPYQPARLLAQQPVVTQLITLADGGEERRVWVSSKRDLAAGSEAASEPGTGSAAPLRVTIDLDAPRQLRGGVVGNSIFAGSP